MDVGRILSHVDFGAFHAPHRCKIELSSLAIPLPRPQFRISTIKSTSRLSSRRCQFPRAMSDPSLFPILFPESGTMRDLAFAILGASASLTVSAALAWTWHRDEVKLRDTFAERGRAALPEPTSTASQKESVEWVNMVVQKIWRVYRKSLEQWLISLLQPAIDKLPKPEYVTRVEIAELCLNYEPISLRNVQRRASRRANDLQYHIGVRYTGGAHCLLVLHLSHGGVSTSIPVEVDDLDVDGEMWVKLRLTPRKPYVGILSLAFVKLPTIKLVLAPFRVFNLFAVPFLSRFLSKLLTVDLPRLIVLPRHITFDFLPSGEDANNTGSTSSGMGQLVDTWVPGGTPVGIHAEPTDKYVGELTVTLCEARNLPTWNFSGWSNPFCVLTVGDRSVESKRNRETSHPSGSRDPVWNQDFQFLVEDPLQQKLTVEIKDLSITLNPNIGFLQIPIWQLQDCVPVTVWSPLLQDGPFGSKQVPGEIRLLLTYKSYVDRTESDVDLRNINVPYIKVFSDDGESDIDKVVLDSGSDSDGTTIYVLESDIHSKEGSNGDQDMTVEVSAGSQDESGGMTEGQVAANDWKSALVGKTVGISVEAGKWVADSVVSAWSRVTGRRAENSSDLSTDESMAAGVAGRELLEDLDADMVVEEGGNGAVVKLRSVLSQVWNTIPKFGMKVEVETRLQENPSDSVEVKVEESGGGHTNGRPASLPFNENEIVGEIEEQMGGAGVQVEPISEIRHGKAEDAESLGQLVEQVEHSEVSTHPTGRPINGRGLGESTFEEHLSVETREQFDSLFADMAGYSSDDYGDLSELEESVHGREVQETVIEVSRTGALNKAITELIDLFDRQS